jgi:hypothetical protein
MAGLDLTVPRTMPATKPLSRPGFGACAEHDPEETVIAIMPDEIDAASSGAGDQP